MSRSYKHHPYHSWASGADTWARTQYHQNERSKTRMICHAIEVEWSSDEDNGWEENTNYLVVNEVDYSLRLSDRWSWPSDGGAYYHGSLQSFRRKFDEEVFGVPRYCYYNVTRTVWEDYVRFRNAKYNTAHKVRIDRQCDGRCFWFWKRGPKQASYDYDLIEFLIRRNLIPLTFKTEECLIKWLVNHQEFIIRKWYTFANYMHH